MKKIIKTILIISIVIFGAGFLLALPTNAQVNELVVEFQNTPLFNQANFVPGESVVRWVKVINNSGQPQSIITEAINYSGFVSGAPRPHPIPDGDLSRALSIIIREKSGDELYGSSTGAKTLYDFYQNGEIYLSEIANGNGGFKDYEFEISFPSEKENEWQTATTTFDILIGFQGVEGTVDGGGGGGGWLPPGLTIQNEATATTTETSVVIVWTTSYPATSQVIYALEGEKHFLDLTDSTSTPPKYGYERTTPEYDISPKVIPHSVTIDGLAPGTKYYYRTVSHASLAISEEHSFTTLVAQGQVSTSTASIGSAEPTGEIGASAATPGSAGPAGLNQNDLEATAPVESESPVTEGPNPLLATLSNFITLGTGNNIVGIIILFVIALIIYLAYSYFVKKRKYRLKNK